MLVLCCRASHLRGAHSCIFHAALLFLKRIPQSYKLQAPRNLHLRLHLDPGRAASPLSLLFLLSVVPPPARPLCPPLPGSQPFRCLYCAATFRFPGALQHHVTTEHFKQSESTFPCELCGELFTSQAQLDGHLESEHPKVTGSETQAAASQVGQVMLGPSDTRVLTRGS